MFNVHKNLFNDYQDLLIKADKLSEENRILKYLNKLNEKKLATRDKKIEEMKLTILELQNKLGRAESKLNTDGTNSSIPTSQTPINKKKVIPNTRERTDKSKGGQIGHKKSKLEKFNDDEVTEYVEHTMCSCPHCNSEVIEKSGKIIEKDELDFKIIVEKKRHQFIEYSCKECNKVFHEKIPNNLKEENQYGPQVKTLVLTLSNQGNMAINKIKSVIYGMTDTNINLSEGYIAKLQTNAAKKLDTFSSDLKNKIINEPMVYWDDTVIMIDTKRACLRFYGTEKLALYKAHMHKDKAGLDEDKILNMLPKETIVVHDHNKVNYNEDYIFTNAECVRHLLKDLKKLYDISKHSWTKKLSEQLTKMNHKRNNLIKKGKDEFSEEEILKFNSKFDDIMLEAYKENEKDEKSYFAGDEKTLIRRILDFKENYLMWIYNFDIPFTNNLSERSLRGVKSKQKASGQFWNENTAKNYVSIHSYVETCHRNGINIYNALLMLSLEKPYTLSDILSKKDSE